MRHDRFEITLLRHAESTGNTIGIQQGHADYGLTERGQDQARELATRWQLEGRQFDLAITSPLLRARHTAEIIAYRLNIPLELDPLWIEFNIGRHSGLTLEAARQLYPHPDFMTPYDRFGATGESRWETYLRAGKAIHSILCRPPGRYLVISHDGLLNLTMYAILGLIPHANFEGPRFILENTAFTTLEYEPATNKWRLFGFNDHAHWKSGEVYETANQTHEEENLAPELTFPATPSVETIPNQDQYHFSALMFSVRPTTPEDLNGLSQIHSSVNDLHSQAHPDVFKQVHPDEMTSYLSSLFAQPGTALFVAEIDSEIVGAVAIMIRDAPDIAVLTQRRYAIVDFIGVRPDHQHLGIGKELMQQAHTWARERGADRVELTVWEFNQSAFRFYEQLGYVSASRRMWKKLE